MHSFAPPDHGEVGIKLEELRSPLREWQNSVPLWPMEVVRGFNSALLILGASALSQFTAEQARSFISAPFTPLSQTPSGLLRDKTNFNLFCSNF